MTVERKRTITWKRSGSWALRVICLSVILAIADTAIELRAGTPFFSLPAKRTKHEAIYVGFGYTLRYYTYHGGRPGPDLWFWFAPIRIQMWGQSSVHWIWSADQRPTMRFRQQVPAVAV